MALSGVTHNPNAQIELGRVLKHLFHLNPLRQRAAEYHIQNIALRMKDEQFSDIKNTLCQPKSLTDSTRDCLLLLLIFRMVVDLWVVINCGFIAIILALPLASTKAYWLIFWSKVRLDCRGPLVIFSGSHNHRKKTRNCNGFSDRRMSDFSDYFFGVWLKRSSVW